MNRVLLLTTLEKKEIAKKKFAKHKELEKGLENSSWVLFFADEEFNKELDKNEEIKDNVIDFDQLTSEQGEMVEKKIREICHSAKNQQLISSDKYPIIWFKNIEKIKTNSPLEKSLLAVFDPQQNMKLFGDDEINLSKFTLIATSSTNNMGELSLPLISRLDCVNVENTEPKKFFLDKYYSWVFFGSVLLMITLLTIIFWPKKIKRRVNKNNND